MFSNACRAQRPIFQRCRYFAATRAKAARQRGLGLNVAGLFNLHRSVYRLGVADGMAGRRHRADWELLLLRPVNWLPGVDADSFAAGYAEGYGDGTRVTLWQQQQMPPPR